MVIRESVIVRTREALPIMGLVDLLIINRIVVVKRLRGCDYMYSAIQRVKEGLGEISGAIRGKSQRESCVFTLAILCDTEWKCPGEEETAGDCYWLLPGDS